MSRAGAIVDTVLLRIWRRMGVTWRWYALWILQPKFIVGVSGVLLDGEGRVLLLRHRFWPGASWGLPGGYAHRREPLDQALLRELREETGLSADLAGPFELRSGYRWRLEVTYTGRVCPGPLTLDGREVLSAGFFAPDELPDGLLRDHRALIARVLAAR